jgi:L-threonylcarbamoyladenylate synthase
MKTEVLRVTSTEPDPAAIQQAAEILKAGGLVAFPTETVYGLGARAFDATAVRKIFAAKGRPANNPLIVHVAKPGVSTNTSLHIWPAAAARLAARFWPGPLTLVLPKPPALPDVVTAGGPTWAVRMPDHPVPHALILEAGALAAPSANVSSGISPTTADHVLDSLDGKIELVLDAGPCPGGIESTVIDLTASPPSVLRPGPIRPSELRAVIGEVRATEIRLDREMAPLPSPGTSIRHYAPRATLECFRDAKHAASRVNELHSAGKRVCWLSKSAAAPREVLRHCLTTPMPDDAAMYAATLYERLHSADRAGMDYIVLVLPPGDEAWLAVRDRLRRAATVWSE